MATTIRRPSALTVYLILQFSASLLFSFIFTADALYHLSVVRLNPLQLVLVGTILEGTIFLFEIPTGALADVKSRRLSIIVGYVLIGVGFIVEGWWPLFATVAVAQVLWGLGYTFTSGATQAWIADEVGPQQAGPAFVRGAQAWQAGTLLGIPLSVVAGGGNLALPVVAGGACMLGLALFLALVMPETGFQPRRRPERSYAAMMFDTARETRQLTRRQPILWVLLAIAFFYGLYSEGLDRLSTAHIVQGLGLPTIVTWQPLVWIGLIRVAHNGLALLATEATRRRVDTTRSAALTRVLATNAALIVLAVAGFAITRSFWLGVTLFCVVQVLRSVNSPLQDAWLNGRIDDSNVRATMFSVSSQMDAIGQISGGPLVGLIGRNISVRAALLASALILSPVLPLYRLAYRSGQEKPASLTKTGAATD